MKRGVPALLIAVSIGGATAVAHEKDSEPSCHSTKVDERGDHVMGFDHAKSTHHFLLSTSGGSIEASANDPRDTTTRDAIRRHLAHIAVMFAEGNFDAPMLIHDRVPPGVPTMERKKSGIEWKFEETESGGRMRITTKDPEALSAVHDFLRFQIEDHRTGDPTRISDAPNRKN